MIPVIAIVGRPNVGKSTLFNQLTRSRDALVVDLPGVTRDRLYGEGKIASRPFIVIDTGGLYDEKSGITKLMAEQAWQAVNESDLVFFVVDAREGLTGIDQNIANDLRKTHKNICLVVNKIDGLNSQIAITDFFQLGLGEPIPIAASHGHGVTSLVEHALDTFQATQAQATQAKEATAEEGATRDEDAIEKEDTIEKEYENEKENENENELEAEYASKGIKISIVGKPNVGKSTLVNRMLGEPRVVVFDEPGTTRDSIYIPLERHGQRYTIIDTAGVRRRARISETVEKFSVVKTLQAIENSNVVILVIDAREGITDQDLGLLGFVVETGRALIIAVNKWDGLDHDHKQSIKKALLYRLKFVDFAKIHYISALHGTGVGNLFDSVEKAYVSATKELPTAKLTKALMKAVELHPPPMVQGRRIKLRYAHSGGHNPPLIIIHGNQTEHVPESYRRYLVNRFRQLLKLEGTPIRLEFKTGDNPFSSRRNKLTPRQEYKRKRLRDHHKKK